MSSTTTVVIFTTFILLMQQQGFIEAAGEYIFGFPSNLGSTCVFMRLIATTTSSSNELITVSSIDETFYTGYVNAASATSIDLPLDMMVFTAGSVDRHKGIRVVTSSPALSLVAVSYNALSFTAASTGTFKIHPHKKSAAKEYHYHAVSTGGHITKFNSEILLVAYEDNTELEIISPASEILLSLPADVQVENDTLVQKHSHAITLHRMQTLLIKHLSHDLTGTLISSNNQLAVISGHECGNVPADQDYCDHLLVQVPPTYSWGKEFLLFPMDGRKAGQNYKIVASQSGTLLSKYCILGGNTDFVLPLNGSFYEFHTASNEYCSIVSDKPVLVALLGLGFATDRKYGDPSMVLIPPISNFNKDDVSFQPMNTTLFEEQYVTILTTNAANIQYNTNTPFVFFWVSIPGASSANAGYVFRTTLPTNQLNLISLAMPGPCYAAFAYGFAKTPKHSYSYSLGEDQLSPYDLPLLSLHPTGAVQDGDGVRVEVLRVGETNSTLIVQLHVEGIIARYESVPDSPVELHSYTTTTGMLPTGGTNHTLELDDMFFTNQIVLVRLLPSPDMKIEGYGEVMISVSDDGVLKIGAAYHKTSVDEIIIKTELLRGQFLPANSISLLLDIIFPEDNSSNILGIPAEFSPSLIHSTISLTLTSLSSSVTYAVLQARHSSQALVDSGLTVHVSDGVIDLIPAVMESLEDSSTILTSSVIDGAVLSSSPSSFFVHLMSATSALTASTKASTKAPLFSEPASSEFSMFQSLFIASPSLHPTYINSSLDSTMVPVVTHLSPPLSLTVHVTSSIFAQASPTGTFQESLTSLPPSTELLSSNTSSLPTPVTDTAISTSASTLSPYQAPSWVSLFSETTGNNLLTSLSHTSLNVAATSQTNVHTNRPHLSRTNSLPTKHHIWKDVKSTALLSRMAAAPSNQALVPSPQSYAAFVVICTLAIVSVSFISGTICILTFVVAKRNRKRTGSRSPKSRRDSPEHP